ncbi:MAG: lysozyme inhibitor LprI family protein, partial [Terracidiphilus sp.]
AAADERLKSFEQVIRDLQAPSRRMAGAPEPPANGLSSPVLTPEQLSTEFNSVEQLWRQYRTAACSAAFHQFGGGTGGPSFEAQCELKLTRDHMRELDMIYGGDLHL